MTVENDAFWREVRSFIQQHLQPEDRLLAPVKLKDDATHFFSYAATYNHEIQDFDWVVLHKGMLGKLSQSFLRRTVNQAQPVFANEVFVIFSNRPVPGMPLVEPVHLQPLLDEVDPHRRLMQLPETRPSGIQKQISRWLGNQSDLQSSQLNVLINGLERNTSQLEQLMQTTQRLEKNLRSLQLKVDTLQKKQTQIGRQQPLADLSKQEFKAACRAACRTAFLGNDTILCRVLGKYFLYADSQDLGIVPKLPTFLHVSFYQMP